MSRLKLKTNIKLSGHRLNNSTIILILLLLVSISVTPVFGHGGKHADVEFTHLQALEKATELYNRLIANGKLDQSWEINLMRVNVSTRQKGDKKEVVVSFQRAQGEPQSVYIFFSAEGKYAGSNFTGE